MGSPIAIPYLERSWFTTQTDHEALQLILNMTEAIRNLARWCLRLSEFGFKIVHQAGVKIKQPMHYLACQLLDLTNLRSRTIYQYYR